MGALGCSELPEIEYRTKRLEIATTSSAPLCEGTLQTLDDHVARVETMLGVGYSNDRIRVYWLDEGTTEDMCGEGKGGCFFPATRIVFAQGASITHELVHAVLDSEGESYFMEEGMAEMLTGVGVYYDVSEADASPQERLSLSRSEYRNGGLDYAAAAHFVRWVYETAGPSAMVGLADEIEARSSPGAIADRLEVVMDDAMGTIVDRYRTSAPDYYPGLAHGKVPLLAISELADGVDVSLDCAAEHTRGPLVDGQAGSYRVFAVEMPRQGIAQLRVSGPDSAFVELIDPSARIRRGAVQDWTQPDSRLDPRAIRVTPGQPESVKVKQRSYLLVVGSEDTDSLSVSVSLTAPPARADVRPRRD